MINEIILSVILIFNCCFNNSIETEIIDLNGDGIEDIALEYVEDGYYELIDRNFDGRKDESNKYNAEHYIMSSTADDNFDGFNETRIAYENSLISVVLIDSDYNQMFDILLLHKSGLIAEGKRFYKKSLTNKLAKIGQVKYEYGYPISNEIIHASTMTEKNFHIQALKLINSSD